MSNLQYWSPHKNRFMHKGVEDFDVVFDPIASVSHFLAPLHFAVLGLVSERRVSALTARDIVSRLSEQYEVEAEADLAADVNQALSHLMGADLLECTEAR